MAAFNSDAISLSPRMNPHANTQRQPRPDARERSGNATKLGHSCPGVVLRFELSVDLPGYAFHAVWTSTSRRNPRMRRAMLPGTLAFSSARNASVEMWLVNAKS
jgi:hypothetical protein